MKYLVEIEIKRTFRVEAEGSGPYEAAAAAREDALDRLGPRIWSDEICELVARPVHQLGEPWVGARWYDLHGYGDVVLFEAAYGHKFRQEDLPLLRLRLAELGLVVADSWNGGEMVRHPRGKAPPMWHGCGTYSVRCRGRSGEGDFTPEQLAALTAPRPGGAV